MRAQTRGKKPLHTVWGKRIGNFHTKLVEIDMGAFGEARSAVEEQLRELEGAIRTKLAQNG